MMRSQDGRWQWLDDRNACEVCGREMYDAGGVWDEAPRLVAEVRRGDVSGCCVDCSRAVRQAAESKLERELEKGGHVS